MTSSGDPLVGQKYAENSFREAEKIQDIELMAPVACEICTFYIISGEFAKVVDVANKVLPLLEETQRQRDFFGTRYNVYSGLCAHCAHASAMLGNFEEGKALSERGLQFALEINAKYCSGWVELCYGSLFAIMGDGKDAIEHSKRSVGYLEEAQAIFLVGNALAYLGFGFYLTGELGAAQKSIEKGLKSHSDAKVAFYRSFQLCLLGIVHLESGDLKSAQAHMEEALRVSQDRNEKWVEGLSRIWLGRIIGKEEAPSAGNAKQYIHQGIEICDRLKLKPYIAQGYLFLGELFAETSQGGEALKNLEKAKAMFQEMGMDYWLDKTQEVLERFH